MSDQTFDVEKFLKKARQSREHANEATAQIEMELVRFDGENTPVDLSVDWSEETIWASQKQIAALFDKDVHTINEHIIALYTEGELEATATIRKFRIVCLEGGRSVTRKNDHYNLDVVLSVGYRVSSAKATAFRK